MTSNRRVRRAVTPLLALAPLAAALAYTALSVVETPAPASALGETITATYYVPLFEDNAHSALDTVNATTGDQLSSTTSITVTAPNSVVYYDQWEDGYEASGNAYTQTGSTLVFGDGVTGNGDSATYCIPATKCTGDIMQRGAVLRLNNSATIDPGPIDIPRSTGVVVFDGRDKISATDSVAVTHATWPTNTNALHSEMAAAFDTSRWGVSFVAPVGTDTPAQGAGVASFTYAGMEVTAKEAGTVVSIDANADGDYLDGGAGDVNGQTIGEGEMIYVDGTILQGATAVSSKPVQVFMMTGRIGSNYEDRSYQVFPTEGLVNDYVVPASTSRSDGVYPTALYIHNPQSSSITVTVQTPSGSTNYTVAAGATLDPAPYLAYNEGARLTSTATFAVVAGNGTRAPVSGDPNAISQDYDWGFSPVPARLLLDSVFVGWAPGSQNVSAPDYDPVWVTTTAATTVYVDFDGDSTTGALFDPNGGRYDVSYAATALVPLRVTDTGDNDMTGAHVYTVDDVGIAVAYGEDPGTPGDQTPKGFPGIDLGTTMFPVCGALCVEKSVTLENDLDGDGKMDPGETVTWTVQATNTDYHDLLNPYLFDEIDTDLTYVPDSTVIVINGGPASPVADDVVPPAATLFPYDELGKQVAASIPIGQSVTIRYQTVIDPDFAGVDAICNRAIMTSTRDTLNSPADGASTACFTVDLLRLTKVSNSGGAPLTPGQALAYTLEVTNAGATTFTDIAVTDPLPAGLTWVSTSVTRPVPIGTVDNSYTDDFQVAGSWLGSTSPTSWFDASWTDAQDNDPGAGSIRKVNDGGDTSVRINGTEAIFGRNLVRTVGDLDTATAVNFAYQYRCSGMESGDAVQAQVSPNGGTTWYVLATYSANCSGGVYVAASHDLTAGQWGNSTRVRFVVSNAFSANNDQFFADDVEVTATVPGPRGPSTVAGSAPPDLYTLTDLLPGESATIVVNTTVNNSSVPAQIDNYAWARSGNTVVSAEVTDCVLCFDFGDDPSSYNGAGGLDPGRASKRSVTNTIGDTFQSTGYSGSTGTLDWQAGSWTELNDGVTGYTSGLVQQVFDNNERTVRIGQAGSTTAVGTGLSRTLGDFSDYDSAFVNVTYRCSGLQSSGAVQVQVSPDGGSSWVTLTTISGCNNATQYSNEIITLPPGSWDDNTVVRVQVSSALPAGGYLYVDDIQFRFTSSTTLSGPQLGSLADREAAGAGGAAPNPALPGDPPIGDDSADTADEDGVAMPALTTEAVQIPITISSVDGSGGYANGWLDWDNDGEFDAGESIFDPSVFVSVTGGPAAATVSGGSAYFPEPGTYYVNINMPALDSNGSGYDVGDQIYSRFRVASQKSEVAAATGQSADGEVEDYASTLSTLPVELAHVTSQRAGDSVVVQWRTAQEVENLGFNLYSIAADDVRTQLNELLVPSTAPTSVESQDYSLTVVTAAGEFWLEDVALDGTTEMHGPYAVGESYGQETPPPAVDWEEKSAENEAALTADIQIARDESLHRTSNTKSTLSGPVAQLAVTEAGIQYVDHAQLLAAGIDLTGVRAADLAITDSRGPVAIEVLGGPVFGTASAVQFVGAPLDTLYTGSNLYWLHVDRSLVLRIGDSRSRASSGTPVATHTATVVVDDDNRYSVAAPGADPWYDALLIAMVGPASTTKTVDLPDVVAGQPATVAVELWGITRDPVENDHHVRLKVNGTAVGEVAFDDAATAVLQATLPPGLLVSGANTFEVVDLFDTGAYIDMVAINSYTITYARANVAVADRLDITAAGQRVEASGFGADPIVYRIAASGATTRLAIRTDGGAVRVPATTAAARYVFSTLAARRQPAVTPLRPAADLFGGPADYLMVANGVLVDELAALVAYHEGLGRTVKVVDVADIYQAYSHGVVDAAAIDTYIAAAVPALGAHWVMIVGSDSFDYRDYLGTGAFSLVPSLYGRTGTLVTFSPLDPAYADIDGNGTPDVAFGRMPARTPSELAAMIAKTIAYASALPARTALLVSDVNDGFDYAAVNDDVEGLLAGWTSTRVDLDDFTDPINGTDVAAAQADLFPALDAGAGLTWYLGHSAASYWSDQVLFGSTEVAARTGPPTALAQFGCWNTYYVAPDVDTLAHALLLHPTSGAALVMGSTTLTSASGDIAFGKLLAAQLASGTVTVGEAVLAAKQALLAQGGGALADIELGWTILGDPAIVVGGA